MAVEGESKVGKTAKDCGWRCRQIGLKFHKVSGEELKQRLAELWDVLVENKSQFQRSQSFVSLKSKDPLLNFKRRVR